MLESEDEETKDETGGSALTVVKPAAVGNELAQEVTTNASLSASGIEDSHSVVSVQATTTTTTSSTPTPIETTTNGTDHNDVNRPKQQPTSIESILVTDDDTNRSIPVSSSLISSPLPLQPLQTSSIL